MVLVGSGHGEDFGPRLEKVEAETWLVHTTGEDLVGGGPEGLGEAFGK